MIVLHWIQLKSLCTYARQENVGKKKNLRSDKTYNPRIWEKGAAS